MSGPNIPFFIVVCFLFFLPLLETGSHITQANSKMASNLPCSSKDDFEPGSNIQLFKLLHIYFVRMCVYMHTCTRAHACACRGIFVEVI